MRSVLHILVFALSVSAACVKRQKPKGNETSLDSGNDGAPSSGPGRQLLETTDATTPDNGGDGDGADGGSGSPPSSSEGTETPPSDNSAGTGLSFNGPKKIQAVSTPGNSIVDDASDQTADNATISAPGAGNCGALKGVCFNGGMKAEMYDQITTATTWTTFQLTIPEGGASPRTAGDFIPMMAFARDVGDAIKMVTSDNPPEWLLTFNEPDFSYQGVTPPTPRMDPEDAAAAILPLRSIVAERGTKTRFVAPATADSSGNWQELFFAECDCRDFFSAYNVHSYHRTADGIINDVNRFRSKHNDKPLWITEVAPGNADCTVGWDEAGKFMKDIYKFSKDSGFVDRVYWNSGNAITNGDTNICNSWLMDPEGKPGPLLDMYEKMDCT
ncbi:MAG: hypothetical protein Q9183_002961 [Haloplaca sp. 2 TL-2023]